MVLENVLIKESLLGNGQIEENRQLGNEKEKVLTEEFK